MTMRCRLCGEETTGSTGAAGIRWPSICQRCKDAEDAAIDKRLATQQAAAGDAMIGPISNYDSWKLPSPEDDDHHDEEDYEDGDEFEDDDDEEDNWRHGQC